MAHASGSSIFVDSENVLAFCRVAPSLNQAVGEIYASDAKLAQCRGDDPRAFHSQFLAPSTISQQRARSHAF
jgi:hypothetical protein